MTAYNLEEQEQIDNLKAWWRQYGNRIALGVCLVAVVVIAWQGWNWQQRQQASQAGVVYAALFQAIGNNNAIQARSLVGELTEKFSGTTYAPMGALLAAKYAVTSGDAKTAEIQLNWAIEHGKNELADLARLRLAALLLDEKSYDKAIDALEHKPADAFAALYAELKGDIHIAQGKPTEARVAYQDALQRLQGQNAATDNAANVTKKQANSPVEMILQQKLDALGGAA
jgi:predicted negative regulator of RcsB-dependent stress response